MPHKIPATTVNDISERKHEPDAIWAGMVASFGIGLLVLVIIGLIGVALAFYFFVPDASFANAGKEWQLQNLDPGVEPNQAYSREKLQAEEETYLQGYSWQDEEHGIARIPIKRAIDLLSKRNLQVNWPPSELNSPPSESSPEEETP